MAAVIRVKRRINEEPLNAFVLNCKKRKIENNVDETLLPSSSDETSTILKFAGTVNSQDDHITSQIYKITKEKAESIITKVRKPEITSKARENIRQNTINSRFKIVNCSRPIELEADNNENKQITVVDIEKQIEIVDDQQQHPSTSNSIQTTETDNQIPDKEDKWVYDLYLTDCAAGQENNIHDNLVDNLLSIRPFDELVYGSHRDNGLIDGLSSDSDESEDSNNENNWRNEYPSDIDGDDEGDDDGNNSIGEKDIRRAVKNIDLDDDLLSTDDESHYQNGFVYSIDPESIAFEDDIDCCDINRYGEAYARYKARVIKKTTLNQYKYDDDEDEDDDDRVSDLDELDNYE